MAQKPKFFFLLEHISKHGTKRGIRDLKTAPGAAALNCKHVMQIGLQKKSNHFLLLFCNLPKEKRSSAGAEVSECVDGKSN